MAVIYCDFMRAFDTVPHRRLIRKLETYGVTGNLLNWIHSFLTGRKQRVCVGDTFSMCTYNDDYCQKLQEDLDSLYSWTNDSLLKFHPQKCKHM